MTAPAASPPSPSAEMLRGRTLTILADLIAFPILPLTPNLEIVRYVAARLCDCGAYVMLDHDAAGERANLFATIGPQRDGGVMLAGHTDVVAAEGEWSSDPFIATARDGRVFGRGACDMKGFLACMLAMAPVFAAAEPRRPVHLAFTYDEEIGCVGARALTDMLKREAIRPAACIVGEPTGMRVVDSHKGCFEYTTEFAGLSGHASQPDQGVNAVHCAARFVAFLLSLSQTLKARTPPNSRFDPPWTTLQVGRIAGGEARNVIAGHCTVEWEVRPVSAADAEFVRNAVGDFVESELLAEMRLVSPHADVTTHVAGEVAGLEPRPGSPAAALAARLNGGRLNRPVSFGTEAGIYQEAGIPTVLCGPGSIAQAHTVDEFIEIGQIDVCLRAMAALARELARDA